MDDSVFRIVPLRKGQEGQGHTYYACMQVSTGLYMNRRRAFSETDIYSLSVRIHDEVSVAIGFAEMLGYTLDTESELLVRLSFDGVKLSRMRNKLEGAFFSLRGEPVAHGGSINAGVFNFYIPADVNVVRLHHEPTYGWVLCEEKDAPSHLTGRAWIPNVIWPRNCVNIQ